MGDRFYDDLENALSSYSMASNDDYYSENEEQMESGYEEEEVGKSEELACPFCIEDFDVLGLCCHIDADHRMEVKPGICPVCAAKVAINMASHKHRGARARSSVSALRKEMQEKHLLRIKESPNAGPSFKAASDSMLLSFINNPKPAGKSVEASRTVDASLAATSSTDDYLEKSLNRHLCQQTGIMRGQDGVSFYRVYCYPPFLMTYEVTDGLELKSYFFLRGLIIVSRSPSKRCYSASPINLAKEEKG
ncbi:hypothetical protein OROMI_015605 [Orobanche minor]